MPHPRLYTPEARNTGIKEEAHRSWLKKRRANVVPNFDRKTAALRYVREGPPRRSVDDHEGEYIYGRPATSEITGEE